MRYFIPLLILCVVFSVTGCATIIRGTKQTIPVQSTPEVVSLDVSNRGTYTTPTSLELNRNNEYTLTFTKEGYGSARVYITKHFNWMVFLFLGSLLDVATGAVYDLKPDTVLVSLVKVSNVPGPDKIDAVLVLQIGTRTQTESIRSA